MKAKILIAASSKTGAKTLSRVLQPLKRGIVTVVGRQKPRHWSQFRLCVCELGPSLHSPTALLNRLEDDAHVVLIQNDVSPAAIAEAMQDPRVNHILRRPATPSDIWAIGEKLASGAIFGMERYLPAQAQVNYQRLSSYKQRCDAMDDFEAFLKRKRLRKKLRQGALQVVEELLMNALYQAPVDGEGRAVFADVSPKARLQQVSPRPVSFRYAVHERSIFISVRDRFGTLQRRHVVNRLRDCSTNETQIDTKLSGAGLGLYLITGISSRMIVNLLPSGVTEVICILEANPKHAEHPLQVFSFTAQRPLQTVSALGE